MLLAAGTFAATSDFSVPALVASRLSTPARTAQTTFLSILILSSISAHRKECGARAERSELRSRGVFLEALHDRDEIGQLEGLLEDGGGSRGPGEALGVVRGPSGEDDHEEARTRVPKL